MKRSFLAALLALCVSGASALAFTHDEGVSNIPTHPQRIVVLDEEALGWVTALGLGKNIVGVGSSYLSATDVTGGKIKAEVLKKGFYGRVDLRNAAFVGSWTAPNLEQISALKPDLIVRLTWDGNQNYDKLSRIAPTIAFKEGAAGFWQGDLQRLAAALGKETQAKQFATQLSVTQRLNAQKLRAAGIFKKYNRVVVLAPFKGSATWVYTRVRLVPELQALGFQNAVTLPKVTLGVGGPISDEALLGLDKKTLVVLFPPGGQYNGAAEFLASAVGSRLKAQSVVYTPEAYSPYSGPQVALRNTTELTRLILEKR